MAEDNYNIIKPVEGLQNLAALKPVGQRQERSKRQNTNNPHDEQEQPNDLSEQEDQGEGPDDLKPGRHRVDYRA